MEASGKYRITLGQLATLVKDVTFANGVLSVKFSRGADFTVDLQAFVDGQGFLTSALQSSDIVDALTSSDASKLLSANQGKILKGFIDNIMAILNSPDTSLDDLQEIVAYIKQNKEDLGNLSINNIAMLPETLSEKLEKDGYTGTAQDLRDLISGLENNMARAKNIRVVQPTSTVVLNPHTDDVVIMLSDYQGSNDLFTPSGIIEIPNAPDVPGKEYWLINHDWWKKLVDPDGLEVLFHESGMGAATHRIQNAVHLKSDGVKWYQTNNYNGRHFGIIPQGGVTLPPIPQVVRYTGAQGAPLNLPDPQALVGQTIKIIFENGAVLNQPFIDLDGTSRPPSVETTAAGTVFEFTGGENWQKIN